MRTAFIGPLLVLMASGPASAQAPAKTPAQAPTTQAPAQAPSTKPGSPAPASPSGAVAPGAQAAPLEPSDNYTYEPDGRRDPFLNLLGTGSEPRNTGKRGDGPAGLSVAEISVRGVLASRGALIAMIEGPDKKTYVVHQGDRFLDGTIRSVTAEGLIIVQEVNDPLSLVKQREVHKLLRSLENAKEKP